MHLFKVSDHHHINVAQATEIIFNTDNVRIRFGAHTVPLEGDDAKRFKQFFAIAFPSASEKLRE
jgi:hypothetical protein